jgi:hypothetical protein
LSTNTTASYSIPDNFVRFSFPTPKNDLVAFYITDSVSGFSSPFFMSPNDGFLNKSTSILNATLASFYNLSLAVTHTSDQIYDLAVIFFKTTSNFKAHQGQDSTRFYMKVVLAAPKGKYRVSFPNANTATASLNSINSVNIATSRKYASVTVPISRKDFKFFMKLNEFVKVSVTKI